jgi:hypothetical protein
MTLWSASDVCAMNRHRFLIFAFVLSGTVLLGGRDLRSVAAASAQAPKDTLAAQLRIQGYACGRPLRAIQDVKQSRPDHEVWVLKCSNATYRIARYPDMAAQVEKLR